MLPDGQYNAADDLLDRNIAAGRGSKTACIDHAGRHSYDDLARQTGRFANTLERLGISRESRIVLAMHDSAEAVTCFLGAIKAGIVPILVNTRMAPRDYAYILADCAAAGLVVSESLVDTVLAEADPPPVVLVDGTNAAAWPRLADAMDSAEATHVTAPTRSDDMCLWLYTSGTTGAPKGVVHLHSHLLATADLYAGPVLQLSESDVVFSAAKLFFAYGLGNSLTFPMAVGATTILLSGPPDVSSVCTILRDESPTVFFGVPTLYAMLLASGSLPDRAEHALRLCVSAGEPLPPDILRRWHATTGVEICDGIGTTEMLHIFASNRPGEVVEASTGRAVPGYHLRVVGEDGTPCAAGEMGILEVSGPTAAIMYWSQREKTKETFRGPWTRTGDNFVIDATGQLTYCGRNDDMLKVGGIYVSPFEVEAALVRHPDVLEAAVVGHPDHDELIKPRAFVVLNPGVPAREELAETLKHFVRQDLAPYKYPRWIEFCDDLPKTATGKIQRFRLRTGT